MASSRGKNTLVQRIALDGGKAIRDELEALGEDGKKAFEALQKAADEASKSTSGFNKYITQFRSQFKDIAAQAKKAGDAYREFGSALVDVGRNVAIAGAAVAGATYGLFKFTQSATEYADAQGKAAQAAGLAVEDYTKLQFAAELADVSQEQLATSLALFNRRIIEAANGTGIGAKQFAALGVKATDANGKVRPLTDVLADVADALVKLPEGAIRSNAALDLFGRTGTKLLPLLNGGAAGIKELTDQAEKLGIVLSSQNVKDAEEFNDSLATLIKTMNGLKVQLGLLFAPTFTEAFQELTKVIGDNKDAIIAFGQSIASQVKPILEDFFKILSGNDSDVANQGLLALRDTIVSIANILGILSQAVQLAFTILSNALQPIADLINILTLNTTHLQGADVALFIIISALLGVFKLIGAAIKGVSVTLDLLGAVIGPVGAKIVAAFAAALLALGALKTAVDDFIQFVSDGFSGMVDGIVGFFKDLSDQVTGIIKGLLDWIGDLIKAAAEAAAALFGLGGGGSSGQSSNDNGHAAGGYIRGPGSGTSDSILSWLSNGEYVVRARAVRKYGLGILNAINGLRAPKFSMGGLASVMSSVSPMRGMLPAYADGGPVSSGRPVVLQIGEDVFEGLIAPDAVADRLVRFATVRQTRQAGKKPGWYTG